MKLIDKDALVSEIEKRISRNKKRKEWEDIPEKRHQLIIEGQLLGELKHFLDSLEVKEVDLEKVFNDEYLKFSNDTDAGDYAFPIDLADFKDFAKHFFELGIQQSNNDNNNEEKS